MAELYGKHLEFFFQLFACSLLTVEGALPISSSAFPLFNGTLKLCAFKDNYVSKSARNQYPIQHGVHGVTFLLVVQRLVIANKFILLLHEFLDLIMVLCRIGIQLHLQLGRQVYLLLQVLLKLCHTVHVRGMLLEYL